MMSSKKIAETKDPAVLAMHEPQFRDGLLNDVRALFAGVATDYEANGTRLQALLLIATVLSDNMASPLGKILKSMGVETKVCEFDWVPERMRTAISLLHANSFLRKQLLFIVATLQMEADLGNSRSPRAGSRHGNRRVGPADHFGGVESRFLHPAQMVRSASSAGCMVRRAAVARSCLI
eukprot:COSAG06_NODE_8921_length_2032_cov_1.497155_1_plen_179_part_00